ncbi:hypothetical protein CAOG_03895 [Capsaspora owczarzaki ATCC 30864]|uniref:Nuclear pore protein n=1 Tax=Capsaspora owczarzaki (strain ATCC 30864) TaxID=595528 RepID=A0A0D2X2R8_CAPO3|nr:hypothetical protein CAOG_03895 [Capsaspora owczarzaki ATCC 30864]KJE93034.1 hypothetical protein CAOG_003895 [Capsaspora owczarzaki ATCC 30864]|eukprot:XP_004363623.1 hypothetical protein CAOG_03895 [Capsaspora owczarzaki ATCC 30864]
MSISFASLVEESSQLTQQEDELPIIEHGPEQVEHVSRKLLAKTQRTLDTTQQTKAHYLLATRGFDADKYTRNLNSISLATFEPLEPIGDTDIQSFLRHEHEMLILTAVEEAKRNTVLQFNNNFVRGLEDDWERVKKQLEAYHPRLSVLDAVPMDVKARNAVNDSFISQTRSSSMTPVMTRYSRIVTALNDYRLQNKPVDVMTQFRINAAQQIEAQSTRQICDLWQLLACMAGEVQYQDGKFVRSAQPPQEGSLQDAYLKSDLQLRRSFVMGARHFLGVQYHEMIGTQLTRLKVSRSQPPSFVADVRSYVQAVIVPQLRQMLPHLNMFDPDDSNLPVWAVIFYCMRCERFDCARDVAALNPKTSEFANYLNEYLSSEDNRLGPQSSNRLTSLYRKEFGLRASVLNADPFKKAAINIICRCDVSPAVFEDRAYIRNIQDYMWMELVLTRETEMDTANETHYSLHNLQAKLLKWAPAHFKTELSYFHALILSAQFETAVNFLRDVSAFFVEAVHFAAALNYYGLLRAPRSIDAPMFSSVTADSAPTFNYAQLIAGYANSFARTNSDDALEYLFLLNRMPAPESLTSRIPKSASFPQPLTAFHLAFRDLALETKDFDTLLLNTTPEGAVRTRGHIKRFVQSDNEAKFLTRLIAEDCLAMGKFEDAVRLHDLATDYERVLELLNRELRNVLVSSSGHGSHRARVKDLARQIDEAYQNIPHVNEQVGTLRLLRNLMEFFDLFHNQQYEQALQLLDALSLLPREPESAGEKLSNAKQLPAEVQSNIPELVLAAMTIYFKMFFAARQHQRSFRASDGGTNQLLDEYRRRADGLMDFAGRMSEVMSGTMNARLTNMHAQMG